MFFIKVNTTLVDFLFIELMLHLSHVKLTYSQPKQLTLELILCIAKGSVDFSWKFCSEKSLVALSFKPVTF